MSIDYKIEPALQSDLDFILSLNQKSIPAVSSTDIEQLTYFLKISTYFRSIKIRDQIVGFLIGLMPGEIYSSENYIWVNKSQHSFIYVDRIVIKEEFRNMGIGSSFYDHLTKKFSKKIKKIICEVNIRPMNTQSMNFHLKYGFSEICRKNTENGEKRVAYMSFKIQ